MRRERITITPEDARRYAFDAEHGVEPARTVAERIATGFGAGHTHPLVDAISHAIEDARELGEKRGKMMARRALEGK